MKEHLRLMNKYIKIVRKKYFIFDSVSYTINLVISSKKNMSNLLFFLYNFIRIFMPIWCEIISVKIQHWYSINNK